MFKLKPRERFSLWLSFRKNLDPLPLEEALIKTLTFWQSCPFSPYYLGYEDLSTWPDPWQLIEENCYCDLAKCLGIVYTLYLTAHRDNLDPEIWVYIDKKTRQLYNLVVFQQGKYVINLIEGEVVNKEQINQDLKLKYRYTAVDLKLEQY